MRFLAFIFSAVGFKYSGLRYLSGILSGRKGALAYCRQEAKRGLTPLPLMQENRLRDREAAAKQYLEGIPEGYGLETFSRTLGERFPKAIKTLGAWNNDR